MAPQMKSVSEAGEYNMKMKETPWKISGEDFFTNSEIVRTLFAKLINASADDIALIPSVSYGISTAVKNVEVSNGEEIIVLEDQFPSNIYSWVELANDKGLDIISIKRPVSFDWTYEIIAKVTKKTSVIAIPNCHWTDGSLVDLRQIRSICDRQ